MPEPLRAEPGGARPARRRDHQRPLSDRLGPGRQHAAQVVQEGHPRRRRPRPADRPLAGPDQATAAACATSTTTSSDLVADRAGAAGHGGAGRSSTACRSCRSTAPAWPTPSTSPTRRPARRSSTSRCSATAAIWHRRLEGGGAAPSSGTDFEDDHWELYHLDEDYAEAHDLAAEQPEQAARR